MRGKGAEHRARRIPIALGQGCSLPLRELGFGRGRSREARQGGIRGDELLLPFPGEGRVLPGGDEGAPAPGQSPPPPNWHLAPARPAPGELSRGQAAPPVGSLPRSYAPHS